MESPSSSLPPILVGSVALAGAAIVALQSDYASRSFLLTPKQLQAKRSSEYKYRWKQALERAVLRFRYTMEKLGGSMIPEIWETADEVDSFCDDLLSGKFHDIRVVRVGSEESGPETSKEFSKEHYVWFVQGSKLHRMPLTMVATRVADKLERKVTTRTFCFVADASAQQGQQLVLDLVDKVYKDDVDVVRQPFWMVCLAVLMQQRIYSGERMEKLTYALCRLEALRFKKSTVLITLPGQSVVSTLLPLLYKVFPDDRHLFCYTGCYNTVSNADAARAVFDRTTAVPATIDEALSIHDSTVFTTPLVSISSSSNVMEANFGIALAKLPVTKADVVETWLTAVDAYLVKKQDDKTYLPFCCKLDFLFAEPISVHGEKNSSYWALRGLLQFITGSRSRGEITAEQMEMAVQSLYFQPVPPQSKNKKEIENAVFRHKLVLIENKTLFDTVLPAEHWTLRAALKQGCACCLPEEDDEANVGEANDMSVPGAGFPTGLSKRNSAVKPNKYVDGKTSFAFDPSKFS